MWRKTLKLRRGIILLAIALSICLALLSCAGPVPTPTSELTPTAEFELSSLLVTPSEVVDGEEITAEANVTNTGEVKGSYIATLTLEGKVSQTKEITLEAGDTKTVLFTYSTDTVGAYRLGLDGLTATLKVLEPTAPEPAEVSIASNRAVADFPDTIAFILDGSSTLPVTNINLEFGTDKRSLVSEVSRVEPEYAPGVKIRTSWVWEMKKTGSLPPGARVWWRWRITDEAARTYVTPRQTVIFEDTRYQWQVEVAPDLDVYWHSLEASLVKELTEGVESRLLRVKLGVNIPEERKPKVFVYPSAEELRSAVLFTQEWTGALAFYDYNIILIPSGSMRGWLSMPKVKWRNTIASSLTLPLKRTSSSR